MIVDLQAWHRSIKNDLRPIEVLDIEFVRGGMGDSIARLPVIKYLLEEVKHVKNIRLFAQDYFKPLVEHCFPTEKVKFFGFSEKAVELARQPSRYAKITDVLQHTTLRTHLTYHAFNTIIDQNPLEPKHYNYLKVDRARLPKKPIDILGKYVVICIGFTAAVREWLPEDINKVTSWLCSQKITPVFLGKSESAFRGTESTKATFRREEIDFASGIDLVDKTSLLEACAVIEGAAAIVGVDNGLLHLAGMTNIPIIGGYTTVNPVHRLPIRWNQLGWNCKIVEPTIGCKFCQTEANFLYDFDFRQCYYGDYKCVSQMWGEKFIEKLKEVL